MALTDIYTSTSNFLKAEDLINSGNASPVVLIESVEIGEVGEEKKKQIILHFKGAEKKLGLNKTNAMEIARLTGTEDWNQWVGHQIRLFVTKVEFQHRMVDAIRIFPELPMAAQAPQYAQAPPTFQQPPVAQPQAQAVASAPAPVVNDPNDEIPW